MLKRKIIAIFMAVVLAFHIIEPMASFATGDNVEKNVVTIDGKSAKEEALLHRQDGIEKSSSRLSSINKPVKREVIKNNKPNRIVVNFNGDPKTSRAFNWFTTDKLESYVIVADNPRLINGKRYDAVGSKVDSHYVERDLNGFFIFQLIDKNTKNIIKYFTDEGKVPGKWNHISEIKNRSQGVAIGIDKSEEWSYKAKATGLKPSKKYYYQVVSGDEKSQVGEFVTAGNKGDKFTFLQYTDTQNAYWNENLIDEGGYGADTLKNALKTAPDASFVVHTGDIVEIAEVEDEWIDLFEKSKNSFMKTTIAPVSGNHDEYGISTSKKFTHKFNDHFNVPAEGPIDGGSYYSYDYNGVHFVVLNTNDNKNPDRKAIGDEQMAWIKKDVEMARAAGAKWVVLNYHKPLFSKGYHSLQDSDVLAVKEEFMKLIDELDIDLALQGHDHVISRTKSLSFVPTSQSLFNGKVSEEAKKLNGIDVLENPKGTTFVLPNTGGTKAYDSIYDKGLDHVKKVRPRLSWLTQDLLDEYNSLFAFGEQPQKSPLFANSHTNFRDSTKQNFAKYIVDDNTLKGEIYQVEGKLEGERTVKLVDSFKIIKGEKNNATNINNSSNSDKSTDIKKEIISYKGENRYETAVEISKNNFKSSDTIIIASGNNFADGLAASYLSKLYKAPILLVGNSIPKVVKDEIKRLEAKKIIIVGGDNSVPKAMEKELSNYEVERISGANRVETSLKIANIAIEKGKATKVIMVNGKQSTSSDALVAAMPVFKENSPVILTTNELGTDVKGMLSNKEVTIIGGNNSVSKEIEDEIKPLVKSISRISGENRYQTSVEVAKKYMPDSKGYIIVNGEKFADALSAGSILNNEIMPILLVDKNISNQNINQLINEEVVKKIIAIGGSESLDTSKLK